MNFNLALEEATTLSRAQLLALQEDIYLVRDLLGRIRILLAKRRDVQSPYRPPIEALTQGLVQALGKYTYAANDVVMYREELKGVALPSNTTSTQLAADGTFKVLLHDRLLMGTEWNAVPIAQAQKPKRFTLYSMKGGVGRSTTAAVLASHLAKTRNKRVLVVDLDLESPGVGPTLLPDGVLPMYGVVDWFVEDALDQAAPVLANMVAVSPLANALSKEIFVVPTFGTETGDYLAKLGRTYLERGPTGPEPWPKRLLRLIEALEAQVKPDVVLLDSRTGLHDTSAALVLAMGAQVLMFATDSRQTWKAYEFLFEHWRTHPDRDAFRNQLWLLASMVPDPPVRDPYLLGLTQNAHKLFSRLYDATFTFDAMDPLAPHAPRPILWSSGLQTWNPTSPQNAALDEQTVDGAYRAFLKWFDETLLVDGTVT